MLSSKRLTIENSKRLGIFCLFSFSCIESLFDLDVVKLRTTPALFRAYEQAYNNLADNYCPGFHLSKQVCKTGFLVSHLHPLWNGVRLEWICSFMKPTQRNFAWQFATMKTSGGTLAAAKKNSWYRIMFMAILTF